MKFVKPYNGRFIIVIFLTIALGVLAPVRPLLVQYTLDHDVSVGDYQGMVIMMWILVKFAWPSHLEEGIPETTESSSEGGH